MCRPASSFFFKIPFPELLLAVHRCWIRWPILIFIITLRCRYSLVFVTSKSCSKFPPLPFLFIFFLPLRRRIQAAERGEITFAPRLARTAAGVAIWQSHQEHFTCLTFTCLHAVNKTSLFSVDEPPRASTGRHRQRGAGRTEVEKSES